MKNEGIKTQSDKIIPSEKSEARKAQARMTLETKKENKKNRKKEQTLTQNSGKKMGKMNKKSIK